MEKLRIAALAGCLAAGMGFLPAQGEEKAKDVAKPAPAAESDGKASEDEVIRKEVKRLSETRVPMEAVGQEMQKMQASGQQPTPDAVQKALVKATGKVQKAFEGIDALSKLDQSKAGKALADAMEKQDEGRYFLMRGLGQVGGKAAQEALQKAAKDWSGDVNGPEDMDAMVAQASLCRLGEKAGFEKVLKALDAAGKAGEHMGGDEGSHHYNRACLNAVAGRKDEALKDLEKVKTMQLPMGMTLKQYAAMDPDLRDLWNDPAFGKVSEKWSKTPAAPQGGEEGGGGEE